MKSLLVLMGLAGCFPIEEEPDAAMASYNGVWSATWSFRVDLINTGTNFARDCNFHGSSTFSVWGESNFGPVSGTESMVCSNANNPGAQFKFGGHIEAGTNVISGSFTYWAADSVSFAGTCPSMTTCNASGSDSFTITLTKQP